MKKTLFTAILFHLSLLLSAQETFYLVQFKDKNPTNFSLSNPEEYLSEASINRREMMNIAIDSSDLPVVQSYIDAVASTGATIWYPLKWFNAVIVSNTNTAEIEKIASVEKVMNMSDKTMGGIEEDEKTEAYDYGKAKQQNELLGIDKMHKDGHKGEGIHVAVLDAGFKNYTTNPYFNELKLGEAYDFYSKNSNVADDHNHGADVLSTMAAYDEGSFVGGAPEATYYLYRTENTSYESRIEELMWVAAAERADSIGVDIIQSSLGYYDFDDASQNYTQSDLNGKTAWITLGANHAYTKGILVVSSAGNEGAGYWKKISFPADSPFVLTVGSVNNTTLNKAITSSFGPTSDGRIKPDVMAAGEGAWVVKSTGTVSTANGTSFSAPQMAALCAGLIQALPEGTTPMDVITRLRRSGDKASAPDSLYGFGIPNYERALLITDLEENESLFKKVKVYPNPVNDTIIKVELPSKLKNIELEFTWFTMAGQMLQSQKSSNEKSIELLNVPASHRGQYLLLRVSTEEYYKTFKVKVN
ncbi:S8 family peptidase [Flammeovirga aprica]|uniref:S8 family serine peptidase n=1 Tax=Flammeovirga aprica JL-4 TaxID=694437 RepID=A0A7X9NZJ0_9BACT|nr:S8 family peptidase [Flammeovirga aprica]NME66670.1 S8 family serine peptidase [Flammeovirga aprica JL-4]